MRNHKDTNHMPMGHFPIPICHIGNGNWEMAHWHMVRVFVSLWFLVRLRHFECIVGGNMNRRVPFMLPFVAVFALVTAAYAGGWAIITVNHVPDYAVAGQPLTLTFSVRQHGKTLLSALHPTVQTTTAGGRTIKVSATRTAAPGEYSARLTFPQAGEWTITILSGFNTSTTTLPVLKVVESCSPPLPPFSPATRGVRLFTSKGCVGCHRHVEANPDRKTDPK